MRTKGSKAPEVYLAAGEELEAGPRCRGRSSRLARRHLRPRPQALPLLLRRRPSICHRGRTEHQRRTSPPEGARSRTSPLGRSSRLARRHLRPHVVSSTPPTASAPASPPVDPSSIRGLQSAVATGGEGGRAPPEGRERRGGSRERGGRVPA
jgi:hypothetical protein